MSRRVKSYYVGKHATHYNNIWQAFLHKTLEATYAAIDIEELQLCSQKQPVPLRFLDAGCGTGLLLKRLAHLFPAAELYGIDASPDMLIRARQLLQGYPNVHFHTARLSESMETELPYPPAFFDLITCTNVLHYLQQPVAILKSFRKMLSGQGQLVLEDYMLRRRPFPWQWLEWAIRIYDPEHIALFSQSEAQSLCQQAGLHVTIAQTFPLDFVCQGWVVRAIHL